MSTTDKEIYSYSRLTTYTECPRKYRFKYIERKREAFESVEAFVGHTVHDTLAWLYQTRESLASPSRSDVLEVFETKWREGLTPRIKVIKRDDSLEERRTRGRELVARHHDDAFQRDRLRTVATEESLETDLGDRHGYCGIIDRMATDAQGRLHLIDFKTTARPPSELDAKTELQLRSYGLLAMRRFDQSEVRLNFHFLSSGQDFGQTMGSADETAVARELLDRIDETERATSFPPHSSTLCSWCGYRETCDASGYAPGPLGEQVCPRCGGELRQRDGRRGPFLGCGNYPDCRFTRDVESNQTPSSIASTDECPRCGGGLERRNGRFGEFLGCRNYPECRYSRDA